MAKKKDTQTQELFSQPVVPKMPEGYYSGDKPNPSLRAFVEKHLRENPYDSASDHYDVPAFDKTIETTKANAIYNMHTYWSKKPHDAIRQYITHYTNPGDLVFDPFCGSGGTALAALADGRKAIAIDRSPAATFITKNYCTPIDGQSLLRALEHLQRLVQSEIDWLYETRCHVTDKQVATSYTVFSQIFQCPRCLEKVALFDCVEAQGFTGKGKPKSINACPTCFTKGHTEEIRSQSQKFGYQPVLVSYVVEIEGKRKRCERRHNDPNPKARDYFQKYDVGKLNEIKAGTIPYWYPKGFSMEKLSRYERDALRLYDIKEVADLFTKRNLWALATLADKIGLVTETDLRVALTWILLKCSRMMRFCEDGIGRILTGTYYIPQIGRESHVWSYFKEAVGDIIAHHAEKLPLLADHKMEVVISTEDARKLDQIDDNSVDYIFTDPPYGEKIQYAELNYVWEAWLNFDTKWHSDEVVVNEMRGVSEAIWADGMQRAFEQCYRVLKPGRWLSLCYHDTSEGTWSLVQDIMKDVGFEVDSTGSALFIDTTQKTHNQISADKVTKRDLVINFRKPKPGEQRSAVQFTGAEDQQSFREKAQAVIREFLQANPGSTKDRIYDQLVSRLVRRGEMEAHDFDELLRQVADEVKEEVKKNLFEKEEPDLLGTHQISRWHLKETEAGADDAEQATTDSAGTRIHEFLVKTTAAKLVESEPKVTELQADIAARRTRLQAVDQNESDESRGRLVREIRELTEKLEKLNTQRAEWEQQALDYSQIFEFYVAAVNPKPKARLEEILEDYCYQTDEGNWRPPLTEQEKLEKGSERQQAVRRKIQRFCKLLETGDGIPDAQRPDAQTLADWIRHCRRTGSHAQGRLLYERGGLDTNALNEQAQVDVEEDYQVCVKHLERGKK